MPQLVSAFSSYSSFVVQNFVSFIFEINNNNNEVMSAHSSSNILAILFDKLLHSLYITTLRISNTRADNRGNCVHYVRRTVCNVQHQDSR